ncbi:MAG: AraC family transcriptional regulator [Bacteroidia bacterium]|nr:AraC family transcriptional regulator [Bacteroidia bacterium]
MITQLESFKVIGISVRTTNENGQATKDIPFLWNKFFIENISEKIPHKESEDLYCLYTHYEKDHTTPYTTILGYKVKLSEPVPEGLVAKIIDSTNYKVFSAKGKIAEGFVFKEWQKIWNLTINRSFTSDFEVYNSKSQDPENTEVDIYIALN